MPKVSLCGVGMTLTFNFSLHYGRSPPSSWWEWFLVAMLSLEIHLKSLGLFLDFIWGLICQTTKSNKNGSLCSVFWIFFLFLTQFILGQLNDFYCIWALLTKLRLATLVLILFFIFEKCEIYCNCKFTAYYHGVIILNFCRNIDNLHPWWCSSLWIAFVVKRLEFFSTFYNWYELS
jgi:hypothetical protein